MPEGPLIAIVDDDGSIRNAMQDLLRAAGFTTSTFANASAFLESPDRALAQCLVADMRMPGMTGLELHEHLAASGTALPTVIVTAHPGELTLERLRKADVTCFLTKPFGPDELLECVRKALARFRSGRTVPRC
jgi:FixJ family two-component response regulator